MLDRGRLDDAAEHLGLARTVRQQLVQGQPESLVYQTDLASTLADLARLDQKAGRPEKAARSWRESARFLTRVVAQRPDDPKVWKDLGLVHAGLGQPEAAATAFARVMELMPRTNDYFSWWLPDRAGIGEALAPYDEIFARVVQMRPTDRNLLIARFHYFGRRRRWREAADIVARIIALVPDDGWARLYHRNLLYHLGDLDGYQRESRLRLRFAGGPMKIEGTVEGSSALLELGGHSVDVESYRKGRYAEAIRHGKELIETDSHPYGLTQTHLLLAMAHQKLGQSAEARKELEVGRKLLNVLGRSHGERDSRDEGLMTYGWTERLHAKIILDEAEALILYDPIFPADPFAR